MREKQLISKFLNTRYQFRTDQRRVPRYCIHGTCLDDQACVTWGQTASNKVQPDKRGRAIPAGDTMYINARLGFANHAMKCGSAGDGLVDWKQLLIKEWMPGYFAKRSIVSRQNAWCFADIQQVRYAAFQEDGQSLGAGERSQPK